jgi:hypothetical protein
MRQIAVAPPQAQRPLCAHRYGDAQHHPPARQPKTHTRDLVASSPLVALLIRDQGTCPSAHPHPESQMPCTPRVQPPRPHRPLRLHRRFSHQHGPPHSRQHYADLVRPFFDPCTSADNPQGARPELSTLSPPSGIRSTPNRLQTSSGGPSSSACSPSPPSSTSSARATPPRSCAPGPASLPLQGNYSLTLLSRKWGATSSK